MIRRAAFIVLVGLFLLLQPLDGHTIDTFATYEDWTTSPTLRGDRWAPGADPGQEIEREVKDGKFLMRFRRQGGGAPGFFSHRLSFARPLTVDQVEAELTVRDLDVGGCAGNTGTSTSRAVAIDINRFSNFVGTRTPGDLTGDHIARIRVQRASDSTDRRSLDVEAQIFRAENAAGSVVTAVFGPVSLGKVRLHEKFLLRLAWDRANHQFVAALNELTEILPYTASVDTRDANVPFVAIRTQHLPAACGEALGDAEVVVGEVRTNTSAVVP